MILVYYPWQGYLIVSVLNLNEYRQLNEDYDIVFLSNFYYENNVVYRGYTE